MESEGVSTNTSNESQLAVSYSYGKVANTLQASTGVSYKRPKFVEKLEKKFSWDRGNVETIDEIDRVSGVSATKPEYYDGTRNLKYFSEICAKLNKLPDSCAKQENCGWCYSTNTCIHGTSEGPADNCLPRHFLHKGKQI